MNNIVSFPKNIKSLPFRSSSSSINVKGIKNCRECKFAQISESGGKIYCGLYPIDEKNDVVYFRSHIFEADPDGCGPDGRLFQRKQ